MEHHFLLHRKRTSARIVAAGRPQPPRHTSQVGVRNYLVEGVSASGKTSVCRGLMRRGYHAINGDRELAYQGDRQTGKPTNTADHEHHLWNVGLVRAIAADSRERATFFCGGSRNFILDADGFLDVEATLPVLIGSYRKQHPWLRPIPGVKKGLRALLQVERERQIREPEGRRPDGQ